MLKNEPLPLLHCFVSHPLPLEANKILPLSCCPFANWIKQNRLESDKPEWIWLLWNPKSAFLERQRNTGADCDYYLCALKTILFCSSESEIFCLLFLGSFFFFKVLPAWAETAMENGIFFVQVFYVCKWAGSSCLTLPVPPINAIKVKKKVLHVQSSLTPLFFYHRFNLWWNAATLLNCLIKTVLHLLSLILCFFYPNVSEKR